MDKGFKRELGPLPYNSDLLLLYQDRNRGYTYQADFRMAELDDMMTAPTSLVPQQEQQRMQAPVLGYRSLLPHPPPPPRCLPPLPLPLPLPVRWCTTRPDSNDYVATQFAGAVIGGQGCVCRGFMYSSQQEGQAEGHNPGVWANRLKTTAAEHMIQFIAD